MLSMVMLVALLVLVLVDVVLFSYEEYEWSVTVMIASITAAYLFQPEFHAFVHAGWYLILMKYMPIYLGVGLVTAIVKWAINNVKCVGRIREAKKEFDTRYPIKETLPTEVVAETRRKAFVAFFKQLPTSQKDTIYSVDFALATSVVDALTPRAKDHVGLITLWIFQWPVVIVEILIADLLIKLGKHTARLFDTAFSYFSRKLVANATKGL